MTLYNGKQDRSTNFQSRPSAPEGPEAAWMIFLGRGNGAPPLQVRLLASSTPSSSKPQHRAAAEMARRRPRAVGDEQPDAQRSAKILHLRRCQAQP